MLLSADAKPARRRSLQRVHEVCVEQHERGSRDFSLKTLGTLLSRRGGPSEASLGNANAKAYRALIACHREAAGVAASRKAVATVTPELMEARQEAKAWRDRAQALLALVNDRLHVHLDARNAPDAAFPAARIEVQAPVVLDEVEREGLRGALAPHWLKQAGWSIDATDRVRNAAGKLALPTGFAGAWRKLVAAYGHDPDEDADGGLGSVGQPS